MAESYDDKLAAIYSKIMTDPENYEYSCRGIEPLFKVTAESRLVIIGQAPGQKAEASRLYWNDMSGVRLREWLGISEETFYHSPKIAHLPMDFYYPGKAKKGDAPPRPGFAEKWHPQLLELLPNLELRILAGNYAQKYYLPNQRHMSLTEKVRDYQAFLPKYFPIVHPSPLNGIWLKRNPWFESEVVPILQQKVALCLS